MTDPDVFREALNDFSLMSEGEAMTGKPSVQPSTLAFGTVVRAAPIAEGGELVLLDWDSKTVEATVPIRPRNPTIEEDPNPRGNGRGCRGVRQVNGRLVASTYHTLELYDDHLNQMGAISGGLMAGLHEIALTDRGTVWVTSTAIDATVEYNLETGDRIRAYWPREMDGLQAALGLRPLDIDKSADNRLRFLDPAATDAESHLHLNAVEVHDGALYALFNAYGVVANLTTEEVVLEHEHLRGGHNLVIGNDGIAIVNDSFGKAVRFYDLDAGQLQRTIDLTEFEWVRDLIRWEVPMYWGKEALRKFGGIEGSVAKPLFVRGLARREDTLFIGVSPAAILQVDVATEALVDAYQYSSNVHACIHGLAVLDDTAFQAGA